MQKFYKANKAMEILGFDNQRLIRWADKGKIKFTKVGRERRYLKSSVDEVAKEVHKRQRILDSTYTIYDAAKILDYSVQGFKKFVTNMNLERVKLDGENSFRVYKKDIDKYEKMALSS